MGPRIFLMVILSLLSLWVSCLAQRKAHPLQWYLMLTVEFVGGPKCWNTRTFSAAAGKGAFCNGDKIYASQTDKGVRMLGAASLDMCHVALAIVEAYWEYRLKPWDMAAGVLIVEEAGGTVSCMDRCNFSVFDRSVLVSNGILHAKLLERIGPATEKLKIEGIDFSLWYKPEIYCTQPKELRTFFMSQ